MQAIRALVNERLNVAAEEIFGFFERTITQYEREVSLSKLEIDRQRKILNVSLKRGVQLPSTDAALHLPVCKEEVPPEQQERSPSLGQEEPEPLQIKQEQEELWTNQEGEQPQGLEEADVMKFTFTPTCVRNADQDQSLCSPFIQNVEGESLPSTSTEQMKTEPDGEACGGSERADECQSLLPDGLVVEYKDSDDNTRESDGPQPVSKTPHSERTETVNGQHVSINRSPPGGSTLKSPVQTEATVYSCKVCGKSFLKRGVLMKHVKTHANEPTCQCGLCGERFESAETLILHIHSEAKPTCKVCGKSFSTFRVREAHMRIHRGEKPFRCSICGKRFTHYNAVGLHVRRHTGEKPYRCTECGESFIDIRSLNRHTLYHTGEKPYRCPVCEKGFGYSSHLKKHMKNAHCTSVS